MCSDFLVKKFSRAAAFSMGCNLCRRACRDTGKNSIAVVDLTEHQSVHEL